MPHPLYLLQPGQQGHLYKEELGSSPRQYIGEHKIPQSSREHNSGKYGSVFKHTIHKVRVEILIKIFQLAD